MNNLDLGFRTKHYHLIYQDGKILDSLPDSTLSSLEKHLNKFSDSKNHNIWFDEKNSLCFSQAQYKDTVAGKDHHFLDLRDRFLHGPWGLNYTQWDIPDIFENVNRLANEDIVYSEHERLSDCKDKSVLIVCGGPSTKTIPWENLDYDSLWSCNHFYLGEKLKDKKLDLVTVVAGLVDVNNDKEFNDYVNKFNPLISFEIEQGCRYRDKKNYQQAIKFCKSHMEDVSFFHTRYRGQPGLGLRMVIYAIFLGYKNISFVGIDGRSKSESSGNLLHSFSGAKPLPNWYKMYGDDFQERQFIIFWEYVLQLSKQRGCRINNLGEGTEYNVLSKLFAKHNPLPEDIREALDGAS
tara:strand:- start:1519 stop:2568 length:1050 start_codon:yes stop_codon:yes gene_type:complete